MISKGKLKAKMLQFFREIEKTGKPLIVTDNNKPVLKIFPIKQTLKTSEVFADIRSKKNKRGLKSVLLPTISEWNES